MKLKNKLCDDFIFLPPSMRTPHEAMCADCFISGFEIGRTLAVQIFRASYSKYAGMDFYDAFEMVVKELENMGEEEA